MFTQGHASVPIVKDIEFSKSWYGTNNYNAILLGGPYSNTITNSITNYSPIQFANPSTFMIGGSVYNATMIGTPLGIIYLTPFPPSNATDQLSRLAVVVAGTTIDGFNLAASLFPSYSGITLPDYVVLSNEYKWKGSGGFISAGYWNNFWEYDASISYTDYSYVHDVNPQMTQYSNMSNLQHLKLIMFGLGVTMVFAIGVGLVKKNWK
jgi:hypothetical protein